MDQKNNSVAIPVAIVVGFGLIAVAIFFLGKSNPTNDSPLNKQPGIQETKGNIPTVTEKDFIRGNPNAPIMIVEYSDYDCPYCKVFHTNMRTIMDDYGISGKVAWTYRQYPIETLHPTSPKVSEAAFCVGEIAGNEAFWKFTDIVFDSRETNQLTNITKLGNYAEQAGVNRAEFDSCLSSGRMLERVNSSISEAQTAKIPGTPHSIMIVGDQQTTINGAETYSYMKGLIDNVLAQIEGAVPISSETTTE